MKARPGFLSRIEETAKVAMPWLADDLGAALASRRSSPPCTSDALDL
jgi:hypothetical protein